MSNFICSECGMTNIDCGGDGYKTPKEIELEKENKRLQEQLKEANEIIESLRTYDFTVDDENAEYYQVKWNVEAERFYKNRRGGVK